VLQIVLKRAHADREVAKLLPLVSKDFLATLRRIDLPSHGILVGSPAQAQAKDARPARFSAWRLGSYSAFDIGTLEDLSPLGGCAFLHTVDLSCCWLLRDVSPLANCMALRKLDLSECGALEDVSPLAGCKALEMLNLSDCGALRVVSDLRP